MSPWLASALIAIVLCGAAPFVMMFFVLQALDVKKKSSTNGK